LVKEDDAGLDKPVEMRAVSEGLSLMWNAGEAVGLNGEPRIAFRPRGPVWLDEQHGVADSSVPRWFPRTALTNVEVSRMVFKKAQPDDFYPIFAEYMVDGGRRWESLRPIAHRDAERHDEAIASAGDRKTFWNLCSYRPSAIQRSGFTWKKTFVRGLHGVFIDFDCGRKASDDDYDEPGRSLTQEQVWKAVNVLIEHEVLPPFQLWADGTRGCYGVMLFEQPHPNIEEAAEMWRDVRGYFYRRAKHLAADEGARAITQPLKAPGACGAVRYYSTGTEQRVSLEGLRDWFHAHRHPTDLSDLATPKNPLTVEQEKRFKAAWTRYKQNSTPRASTSKRTMTWQQKAASIKALVDDLTAYASEFHRTGSSRRRFFLDLASAVKNYEYKRDGDSHRAYDVATVTCDAVNNLLDNPLSPGRLKEQVLAADPRTRRSSNEIRLDMGITEGIAERLKLRTLIPPSMRVELAICKQEDAARRAEDRVLDRAKRATDKEAAKLQRKLEREGHATKEKATPKVKRNADRDAKVEAMLRDGLPTLEITTATGARRQQISRIRKRLKASGEDLPEQAVLKRGRKKKVTITS